ncbi:hypothetical protein Vretifemale_11166 [Volvox reticuliferus]|uniref:Uncharacterized protein n=2 Tax=Volvox reticuliferus TaxID=1737510 RepID=A0A8J4FQW0_9CHLO|nr:hypothetical protein Vretifemale_11166 [Volvox reticuliferus]
MEEKEKLEMILRDLEAEIRVLSAKAESAEDTADKNFYRALLLKKEDHLLKEKELLVKEKEKEVLLLEKDKDLRREKLMRLEMLGARGSAAGLGVESTTGSGPPACKLRQDLQNQDLFFFEPMDAIGAAAVASPGVASRFFLDPMGRQTNELKSWLDRAEKLYCEGKPILPLFINGLVKVGCNGLNMDEEHRVQLVSPTCNRAWREKVSRGKWAMHEALCTVGGHTAEQPRGIMLVYLAFLCHLVPIVQSGKSFILNEVLPAVINTYYCSGGSSQQHASMAQPNFLRVNCLPCNHSSGNSGFLMDFLVKLTKSAASQQLSAAASTPIPSNGSAVTMLAAIQDFMERLPRDRLNFLLIDEAQSFYLLERPVSNDCPQDGSTLDRSAVRQMRVILKELLLDSPRWVAWAITGSSMATLWANVAVTPPNGFALIMHHRRLNLDPMVPEDVLEVAWEQLKAQAATWDPALPEDLIWESPQQIAMLAYMCQEWINSRTASTAVELVNQTMKQKLIPEVLADLRMVLQELDKHRAHLRLLLELLDPLAGVEPAKLPQAFEMLLGSFATERGGRLYLDNPLLAQVLKVVTTESGELVDSIDTVQWSSSVMLRALIVLGERCKNPEFNSYKDLHSLLEDMASALALTPDGLLKADWFTHVLDHRYNSRGSKANFEQNYRAQAQQDPKVGLRWFHALLRNVLSHGSIVEQQKALEFYPPKLADFHSSGRINNVVTKTYGTPMPKMYDSPMPRGSKAPGALAAATPRAQFQPHVGPVRTFSLYLGKRLGRARWALGAAAATAAAAAVTLELPTRLVQAQQQPPGV